jgi:pyruvate/2-oxoglutarate dehydrogenase complex dihydrolipoamide acyltransferase (E2) component
MTSLSPRDLRALGLGGAVILVLIAWLLLRGGEPAPPAPAPPQVTQPAEAPAPPPPAPAASAPDLSRLRLYGLMGSGAVIGMADGSQRYVPVGREVLPGVTLARIELHAAVLSGAGGETRIGFDGAEGAAGARAPAAAPAEAAQRDETLRYRLGLAPRRAGGRIVGFTMRSGASLPALDRAGIRPGDTILKVNGSVLDEERLSELSWQIANSDQVEFEVERGGRAIRMRLPRP